MNGWSGVGTTAGTPAGIIARLEAEIKKALSQPQVVAAYENAGLTVRFMGAAEFGKFWDAEIAKFALAIRHSGAVKEKSEEGQDEFNSLDSDRFCSARGMRRRRPAARGSFQGADHDDSSERHLS